MDRTEAPASRNARAQNRHGAPVRPRTIVTADPELDDLNSMIRLLLYSNELQIEGLVYASSRFHWKGDGRGTRFFLPGREYDSPQQSWRWAPGERFIDDAIDAYAEVHSNLVVHDPAYPPAHRLRSLVREGNIEFEGDMSQPSRGSDLIVEALLTQQPGPLHLQAWAGTSTIARALLSIEERYRDTANWDAVRTAVSRNTVITKWGTQDSTYDNYIRPSWPGIPVIDVATRVWGYLARGVVLPEDAHLLGAEWTRRNVTAVGPLGSLYRVWGDGRQMVEGDFTDYFHLSGHTADELREIGYQVWVEPRPAGEWISEGDTTNMLSLFGNGLRAHEHPGFGGWGGRGVPSEDGGALWNVRGAVDVAPDGSAPDEYSTARWFGDAQRDFASRLRWSVSPEYSDANHPPTVTVLPGTDLAVRPGSSLALTATAADPDGDAVSYRWWQYREAGTYGGRVSLEHAERPGVSVAVPADASPGETIHIILEVQDDGDPPLKAYARIILMVGSSDANSDRSSR